MVTPVYTTLDIAEKWVTLYEAFLQVTFEDINTQHVESLEGAGLLIFICIMFGMIGPVAPVTGGLANDSCDLHEYAK